MMRAIIPKIECCGEILANQEITGINVKIEASEVEYHGSIRRDFVEKKTLMIDFKVTCRKCGKTLEVKEV